MAEEEKQSGGAHVEAVAALLQHLTLLEEPRVSAQTEAVKVRSFFCSFAWRMLETHAVHMRGGIAKQ